jgi:hypothetical protein
LPCYLRIDAVRRQRFDNLAAKSFGVFSDFRGALCGDIRRRIFNQPYARDTLSCGRQASGSEKPSTDDSDRRNAGRFAPSCCPRNCGRAGTSTSSGNDDTDNSSFSSEISSCSILRFSAPGFCLAARQLDELNGLDTPIQQVGERIQQKITALKPIADQSYFLSVQTLGSRRDGNDFAKRRPNRIDRFVKWV